VHAFIGQSLASKHSLSTPTTMNTKLVSKTYPSWLEHLLRLARARGYRTLYPVLEGPEGPALATLHNELYHQPEEFSTEFSLDLEDELSGSPGDDFTADPAHHLSLKHTEMPLASSSLLNMMSSDKLLPSIGDLPLLGWDGRLMESAEMAHDATEYSAIFAREIGGCAPGERKMTIVGSVDDLFCLGKGTGDGGVQTPPQLVAPSGLAVDSSTSTKTSTTTSTATMLLETLSTKTSLLTEA